MLGFLGMIFTFLCVFGVYTISGGSIGVVLGSLPHETMLIGGAALGAFLVSNKLTTIKKTMSQVRSSFKGSKWKKQDYTDLLCLLYAITKTIRTRGILALENHIENPEESPLFGQYPRILEDNIAVTFICDTLRLIGMHLEDVNQIEDAIEQKLTKMHHEKLAVAEALTTVADGLPALGIVAAVLGVIKTMSSVDKPPQILGGMIAGALVGTFLGVFLAYCIVGPIGKKLESIVDEDYHFYLVIRDVILSHLRDNPPQISVEIGRANVPTCYQPTFVELESVVSTVQNLVEKEKE
ncbi:flagellar motor stator protein MotA [Candidatus Lariskella endosymbiont of Epinotia ramella]|uniref:flagellar motor stator protein MotA n=1 Tax=Candidatus Lariskella endosymbiont of Epinotia ramella TaxID=3066224 RepID=UPI0030D0736F